MTLLYNVKEQNAVSFTQDNLTTQNGIQYAVFVDADRNPVIAKRTLPSTTWTQFDLSTVTGNPLDAPTVDDVHNNYVVAVDSAGYLHVSGNHHDVPLNYIRSTSPGDITAWEIPGMVGTEENSVTYPQFLRIGAELLFIYRNGSSGDGAIYVNTYDTATQTWSRRSNPLSGLLADGVDPAESPYTNRLSTVGPDGTWHWFFMWRETSEVNTSHDLCHMQSTDQGATFTDVDGTPLTLPVTPTTSPIIKAGWNYAINQCGAAVDSANRPHACWWLREASYNWAPRLVHFWHDGTRWREDHEHVTTNTSLSTLNLPRPMLFAHGDRVFAVYSTDPDFDRDRWWLHDISVDRSRINRTVWLDRPLGRWEGSFDTRAVADRDELHMLITPIQPERTGIDPDYIAQWGSVFTIDLTQL